MNIKEQPVYEVRLRGRRVQRELDSLRERDYQRIVVRLRALAHEARPPGCEKLHDDIYRVRVGEFRIIYFVDDKNKRIEVGGIRRRSEKTYKGIEDLFR
jgi:mRNA interferase RelE/StbE